MTQDEIIELGKQAGIKGFEYYELASKEEKEAITTFAKLVAAKATAVEREACAEIAEKQRYAMCISLTSHPAQNGTAVGIANEIRTRREQA